MTGPVNGAGPAPAPALPFTPRHPVMDPYRGGGRHRGSGGTAIDWFSPSLDGRLVAVSLSVGGSEDGTLHVFDVATGAAAGERIPRVQYETGGGSVAWLEGSGAFLYARYPSPGGRDNVDLHFDQKVWRHELGTPVAEDRYEVGHLFPRIAEVKLAADETGARVVAVVAHGDGGDFEVWLRDASGWQQIAGSRSAWWAPASAPAHSGCSASSTPRAAPSSA